MLHHSTIHTCAIVALCAAMLSPQVDANAQALDSLAPGARVRLNLSLSPSEARLQAPTMLVGALVSNTADTIVIDLGAGNATVRVQRSAIRAAWMSRGPASRWGAGMRGAIRPALGGAAFGAVSASINRREGDPSVASAAAVNAAFGAIVAGVRAAWVRSDRWRTVSIVSTTCRPETPSCIR